MPFGDAGVVGVCVRQDDGIEILETASDRGERSHEQVPVPCASGVDERELAAVLDEVEVDDPVVQSVHTVGDLHRRHAAM